METAKQEIQIATLSEELQKPELTKDHIIYWVSRFRDIDLSDLNSRKRLIDSFINTVYLYDDSLLLVFNYKDGTKTITFDELEKLDNYADRNNLTNMCSDLEVISRPEIRKTLKKWVFF